MRLKKWLMFWSGTRIEAFGRECGLAVWGSMAPRVLMQNLAGRSCPTCAPPLLLTTTRLYTLMVLSLRSLIKAMSRRRPQLPDLYRCRTQVLHADGAVHCAL